MRYFLFILLIINCFDARAQMALPVPVGAQRLLEAYPQHLKGYHENHLIWKDGSKIQFDDGRIKTEDEAFDSTDLEDQMHALLYTPGTPLDTPTYNCDPGTLRCVEFFKKMYGENEAQVRSRLAPVTWPGPRPGRTKRIWVTSVNGVDKHLQAVAKELMARPHLRPYVTNIGGTFNWRPILGTNRLSPHSFGIAIDINTSRSEYWKWDHKDDWMQDSVETVLQWRNSVPLEIVDIFERHGFIWGGKWYHYDTMHFEYRPEMLPPRKAVKKAAAPKATVKKKSPGKATGSKS